MFTPPPAGPSAILCNSGAVSQMIPRPQPLRMTRFGSSTLADQRSPHRAESVLHCAIISFSITTQSERMGNIIRGCQRQNRHRTVAVQSLGNLCDRAVAAGERKIFVFGRLIDRFVRVLANEADQLVRLNRATTVTSVGIVDGVTRMADKLQPWHQFQALN